MKRLAHAIGFFALSALTLHACASDFAGTPSDCRIDLIVETAVPVAGASVVVRADPSKSGFLSTDWTLEFESIPVACTDDSGGVCGGASIAFLPAEAGVYDVSVRGSVGSDTCTGDSTRINVMVPGANNALYRMVVTPQTAAAVFEETIVIPGGANYDLGTRSLSVPLPIAGQVLSAGVPIAAHLRLVSTSQARTDVFAKGTVGYAGLVSPELLTIDVFPADSSIAPLRLTSVDPATLGDIDVAADVSISGLVRDPSGAGLAQAQISLLSDGLPSSIGAADDTGGFALETRAGSTGTIAVMPPAQSGLPILRDAIAVPASGETANITYNPALVIQTPTFTITEIDQATPIAGARVTFVSDVATDAGSVSIAGGAGIALEGRVRRTVTADGSGQIANIALTEGSYSVVIARPGTSPGRPTLARFAVTDSNAAVIAAAEPATWSATVASAGAPIEGARLTFRPLDDLELVAGASAEATTDASGAVSISLTGGGRYELQIDSGGEYGRVHHGTLTAPDAGDTAAVGTVDVAPGQLISGRVLLASGAAAAAHVALYCTSCPTPNVPVGEVVTDASGAWTMALPDSGSSN